MINIIVPIIAIAISAIIIYWVTDNFPILD
jgi:hypothetical protein